MFKQVKAKAVKLLNAGEITHEARNNINEKNLLSTGALSIKDVIKLINKTKGFQFTTSKHHMAPTIDVYIFRPDGWYIKFYFIEPGMMFISVHEN